MKLLTYVERLEAFSLREQMLIGATLIALLASLLQFFLVDPLLVRQQALNNQLKSLASTNERQQRRLDGEGLSPLSNRAALLKTEITDIEQQLAAHHLKIDAYTATLVPATQMPALLQALLEKQSVQLVSLVNLPALPLLEASETDSDGAIVNGAGSSGTGRDVQLYAHGIQLELRGDFHALRRYLIAVEQQPWKLLWQSVRLETSGSGESLMELQLQTLSTDSAWLGV